jgi:hypothetical protein
MFSGKKIGSSTNPNTFPLKFRRNETINLAKEVYDYLFLIIIASLNDLKTS